jgi:hypothetical protein
VEAGNGAVYEVDINTARHFRTRTEAGIYDEERGGMVPIYFDCAPMSYVLPHPVEAQIEAIAFAAAEKPSQRQT